MQDGRLASDDDNDDDDQDDELRRALKISGEEYQKVCVLFLKCSNHNTLSGAATHVPIFKAASLGVIMVILEFGLIDCVEKQ